MNYEVGDTVVCIDAQTIYRPVPLRRGARYLVEFLDKRCVALAGVTPIETVPEMFCGVCGNETALAHFLPSRFIKIEGLTRAREIPELELAEMEERN